MNQHIYDEAFDRPNLAGRSKKIGSDQYER